MFISALVALTAQAPKVSLSYFQEHFIVRDGAFNESAPLKLPPESPKLSILFRKDSTFAAWDERGLTVRVGNKVKTFKLGDVATSPKAFSKEEIRATLSEIRAGRRRREVSSLSGAVRVGSLVYFLARWNANDGRPWAEAIVDVNLGDRFPEPKLVARLGALSTATKPIDNVLFILEGKPSYVARTNKRWGLAQFDLKTKQVSLDEMGDSLAQYLPITDHTGYFVERTAYGTSVAGRVDLANRYRKTLAENRAALKFIDSEEPPFLVVSFGDTAVLRNAATGAEINLPVPCATRRLSRGIVVWKPLSAPKQAWLYDPARWQTTATWSDRQAPAP